jgi:hypothetical protein
LLALTKYNLNDIDVGNGIKRESHEKLRYGSTQTVKSTTWFGAKLSANKKKKLSKDE